MLHANRLSERGIEVALQHIYAHVGTPGNEKADKLAEKGAFGNQENIPTSIEDVCVAIERVSKETTKRVWRQSAFRHRATEWTRTMWSLMPGPSKKDHLRQLSRPDQVLIAQARSGLIEIDGERTQKTRKNP